MIIPYLILLIVLDAIGDATTDKPVKHIVQGGLVLGWLCFPIYLFYFKLWGWVMFSDCLIMISGYICLRYLLFDAVWNLTREQRIDYIGTTSAYDKILQRVHPSLIFFTKLMAGITGIIILLR